MRAAWLLPIALLAACQETRVSTPPPPGPLEGRVVARWRIESGGRALGTLTALAFPEPGPRRYFRVEDVRLQEVGFVTELGVAYRFEPHRAEPVHAATDTMERNLRALFGVEGPVALVPLEPAPPAPR